MISIGRVTDSRFSKTWNLEVLILKSWNLESRLDNSRFQDFKITASRFQVFKIDIFCYFQTFLIVLKCLYLSQLRERLENHSPILLFFCQLFPKMTLLKFVKLKNFLLKFVWKINLKLLFSIELSNFSIAEGKKLYFFCNA